MTHRKTLRLAAFMCLFASLSGWGQSRAKTLLGFTAEHDEEERRVEKLYLNVPNALRARNEHAFLTREPHVAGSSADLRTATYMLKEFQRYGLSAKVEEFRVPISSPLRARFCVGGIPAHAAFCGPSPEFTSGQTSPKIQVPFNAFSASGHLSAPVIYANYGSLEDYRLLDQMRVDIKGRIVLAR